MQDSDQNGEAMHKGIMLSGQSADNTEDSAPASDNMQYVNPFKSDYFDYVALRPDLFHIIDANHGSRALDPSTPSHCTYLPHTGQ